MPTNTESLNRELFRLLSKYKPKPLDAEGKATPVPDEADVFKFEFTKDGEDYGTVYVTLDEDRVLTVYFGDDVSDSPGDKTPGLDYDDTWSGLLHQLSAWRMTKGLRGFDTQNKDRVGDDMARRNHMRNKDKIAESYYATGKKSSYSDAIPSVKIVIEHSRVIEEGEQRYRNINRIFLENQAGERYLLDTKKPGIARVYARHIAEGGKVNDDRWSHIGNLCEEYQKMAGFVRATRNGQFNESAQSLVNEGIAHYASLRESLSRMTGKRGYNAYFESWSPPLMEDGTEENNLNELFVQETLDPRIESVMPILNRIHKKVSESAVDKEMNKLAEWADSLVEEESLTSNNPVGIPERTQEVGQMMANDGITYSPEKENEIINQMAGYMEKSGMSSKQIRHLLSREQDYIADQLSYLPKEGMDEEVSEEVDTGEYDARKSTHKGHPTPEQEKSFREKVQAYGKELEKRQKEKEVDEGLDANQKRVGQLGPTEKVGKKGAVGKLVGANENFINTVDQAVTTEGDNDLVDIEPALKGLENEFDKFLKHGDRMQSDPAYGDKWNKRYSQIAAGEEPDDPDIDEGEHTQHALRGRNPGANEFEHDPIGDIHDKISSMLKRLEKPKHEPSLDDTNLGSTILDEVTEPWETDDEANKREKEEGNDKPKDTKGSDGSEHGGHSRAKHLAKNAIPKDEKKEVNESEERPYVCVHAKKGKCEVKASSSYQAAQKAAQKWGLKGTAGIDAHLADVEKDTSSLDESTDELARILTIMNHRR